MSNLEQTPPVEALVSDIRACAQDSADAATYAQKIGDTYMRDTESQRHERLSRFADALPGLMAAKADSERVNSLAAWVVSAGVVAIQHTNTGFIASEGATGWHTDRGLSLREVIDNLPTAPGARP